MLDVCEKFTIKNNLKYSSDPNPAKSKSKCMLMCGKTGNVRYLRVTTTGRPDNKGQTCEHGILAEYQRGYFKADQVM